MSNESVTINVKDLSNGASIAIALYKQGVDITAKGINQTFSGNIPFSECARHARDMVGVSRETVIDMMRVSERASAIFSEVWNQGVADGLTKAEIKTRALAASNDAKMQGIAGLNIPQKSSPKGINPLPVASKKVSQANPGLTEKLIFQFESAGYRVGKNMLNGDKRVTLTNKNSVNRLGKLEGQTVTILPYGEFLVSKAGDSWANLRPVNQPKADSPKAESPKADSPDAALIAKVTAAVLAALQANS